MSKHIIELYHQLGNEVNFTEIEQFERFEERFFEIERYFGDILGMGLGMVEFCPNNEPPRFKEEILPWLWLLRPSLKDSLLEIADERLQEIMINY